MAEYLRLQSLEDVAEMLWAEGPEMLLLAGGTDLLARRRSFDDVKLLVDVRRLPELQGIGLDEKGQIRVGAGMTHQQVADHPLVIRRARPLALACAAVGSPQIRNLGTIGGNLANASPAADSVPALFCLGAEVHLASRSGGRAVPIAEFFTGPGQTVRRPDELLESVRFEPTRGRMLAFFKKSGQRRGMCCSKASVTLLARRHGNGRLSRVKIALGAVAPTVILAAEAAAELEGRVLDESIIERAAAACSRAARPIDDIRSTAEYRRQVVGALLKIGLLEALDHMRRLRRRAKLRRRRR